ncbi:MAG: class I SAM-dependent methyltransferase [Pseudonocardiaceae bacterium]
MRAGAVAELAARAGAGVTGVDLAPALIETAKQRAQEQTLEIDYRVSDCEQLELDDAAYDRVSSTCGIRFAPGHAATARELGCTRRPDRPRELDTRGRRGSDVQDDGAVPPGATGRRRESVRLGARGGSARTSR